MGRLIGLDVGDRRIGIAVSDALGLIASPWGTYTRVGSGADILYFQRLFGDLDAEGFVVGLPRNMDGSEGIQARKARAFGQALQDAGLPAVFWDERLSTVSAHRSLTQGGVRGSRRREAVDRVAAALILQGWLDALGASGG